MLYDFIEKLQRKPDRVKRQILAGFTVLAAIALFFGFAVTVKDRVRLEEKTEAVADNTPSEKQDLLGPLAALKTGFSFVFSDAKDKLGDLLKASGTTGNQRPIYQLPDNK